MGSKRFQNPSRDRREDKAKRLRPGLEGLGCFVGVMYMAKFPQNRRFFGKLKKNEKNLDILLKNFYIVLHNGVCWRK